MSLANLCVCFFIIVIHFVRMHLLYIFNYIFNLYIYQKHMFSYMLLSDIWFCVTNLSIKCWFIQATIWALFSIVSLDNFLYCIWVKPALIHLMVMHSIYLFCNLYDILCWDNLYHCHSLHQYQSKCNISVMCSWSMITSEKILLLFKHLLYISSSFSRMCLNMHSCLQFSDSHEY